MLITYYLGMLGMHGTKAANGGAGCDLLIAVGARFDDRVTGKLNTFAPNAKVIHMDIDPAEMNKLRQAHVALQGDLNALLPAWSSRWILTHGVSTPPICALNTPALRPPARPSTRRCC